MRVNELGNGMTEEYDEDDELPTTVRRGTVRKM